MKLSNRGIILTSQPIQTGPAGAFQPLPSLEGWRGLAHYRTESRRKVVKKKPEDRTASDLYVLEESVKNVKLIGDLPLAKRLEVCKYLGYEVHDENQHVYEQGATGSTFYIVFTGIVRDRYCFHHGKGIYHLSFVFYYISKRIWCSMLGAERRGQFIISLAKALENFDVDKNNNGVFEYSYLSEISEVLKQGIERNLYHATQHL